MFIWVNRGGQTTTYILMLLAVILAIAMVMVNVGYVGVTRTHTSNAADAGALAAASWIASTENALAAHSKAMSIMYLVWSVIFWVSMWTPFISRVNATRAARKFTAFQAFNWLRAVLLLNDGWEQAEQSAFTYAFINAGIEDRDFPDWLKEETEDGFSGSEVSYEWDRNEADPERGENVVTVIRDFPGRPLLLPQPFFFVYRFYDPVMIPTSCPPFGCPPQPWMRVGLQKAPEESLSWVKKWLLDLPIPVWGIACTCTPTNVGFEITISSLWVPSGDEGELRVTVKHETQDADLRLWQMVYAREDDPEGNVRSHAWAEFGGGRITGFPMGGWPSDEYTLQLKRTE